MDNHKNQKMHLKSSCEYFTKELIKCSMSLSSDLTNFANLLEKHGYEKTIINDCGIIQSQGSRIDVLAGRLALAKEILQNYIEVENGK